MSTAFASPPPFGMPIEVVGLTGEHGSGKTIFSLSIAPGCHPEGHPFAGKPRTLYIDLEKSGSSFVAGTQAERVDVPTVMRTIKGGASYTNLDLFHWFRKAINNIPMGAYDCVVVDPVTDLEDGLVDHVRKNPGDFGYSASQFKDAGGIMWGCVKGLWKAILVDLAARTQVFTFIAHMRMEFKGGRPTGRMMPKGKETLEELASLYLLLDRSHQKEGAKPVPPSGVLLKERLSVTAIDPKTGEVTVVPILPPRLPEATPAAIRHYVSKPVGLRKLKPEEIIQEKEISEHERRLLDLEISQNQQMAEQAKLDQLAMMQQAALQAQIMQQQGGLQQFIVQGTPMDTPVSTPAPLPQPPAAIQFPPQVVSAPASAPAAPVSTPVSTPPWEQPAQESTLHRIRERLHEGVYANMEIAKQVLWEVTQRHSLGDLDETQAVTFLARVEQDLMAQKAQVMMQPAEPVNVEELDERFFGGEQLSPEQVLSADRTPGQGGLDPINEAQAQRLKRWIKRLGITNGQIEAFLTSLKLKSFRELGYDQYRDLLSDMMASELGVDNP